MHPLVTWHRLVGSDDPFNFQGGDWEGQPPWSGSLERKPLDALLKVLARHTESADQCWFCLWDGNAWVDARGISTMRFDPDPPVSAFPVEVLDGPRVRLGRDYILLQGPLGSALAIGLHADDEWPADQSPNPFWPDDRAWIVSTDIDLNSTLVAGSHQLIEELLNTAGIEALPADPGDSCTGDADRLD